MIIIIALLAAILITMIGAWPVVGVLFVIYLIYKLILFVFTFVINLIKEIYSDISVMAESKAQVGVKKEKAPFASDRAMSAGALIRQKEDKIKEIKETIPFRESRGYSAQEQRVKISQLKEDIAQLKRKSA